MPRPVAPAVLAAVAALHDRLRARFGDALLDVRLFGSYARGEAHEGSDVDVFVLLRAATFGDRRDAIDLATDVALETDLPLSATVFDDERYRTLLRQERAIALDIAREGIPL